jgi:hypothetical protein
VPVGIVEFVCRLLFRYTSGGTTGVALLAPTPYVEKVSTTFL